MVAAPIIRFLLDKGYEVTVASNTVERAQSLITNKIGGIAIYWEANDTKTLDELIKKHDLVVSLLPYGFHVMVAEKCIAHKKNMVTTSYVKPEMKALDQKAKEAGIIILNECGLDPGIDHMSAKRIIDTIHGFGGKVIEFYSLCGALPAPEISKDNPFRYKFSWSPKGVILAGNNDASYLKKGKKIKTDAKNLFKDRFTQSIQGIEPLEVYPNRDSFPYIELYDIPETETMFRGTLRYPGWCEIMDALKILNLTDQSEQDFSGMTYAEMLAMQMKKKNTDNLKKQTAKFLKTSEDGIIIKALDFIGLFSELKMNRKTDSAFEIISDLMINKMMLSNNERDMVVLKHIFKAEYPDGRKEVITSKLIDYGEPGGDTSIARTVALPAACAVRMILEEEITISGVYIPVLPDIYVPIMDELEGLGIELVEEYGLPLNTGII